MSVGMNGAIAPPGIHPDRLRAMQPGSAGGGGMPSNLTKTPKTTSSPKVPKAKTVAKMRYLQKKMKKRKKVLAAKKASAPKSGSASTSASNPAVALDNEHMSESDSDAVTSDDEKLGGNAQAGPSRLPTVIDVRPTPAQLEAVKAVDQNKKNKDTKKPKAQAQAEDGVHVPTEKLSDVVAMEDEAEEKERRKREKREKREARNTDERRARKAMKRKRRDEELGEGGEGMEEESVDAEGDDLSPIINGNGQKEAPATDDEMDSEVDDDSSNHPTPSNTEQAEADVKDRNDKSQTPPPLMAFPLPTSAPAPDPKILSRQGLPSGLEDAVFIDQSLRLPLETLSFGLSEGSSKGLSEHMTKRLKEIGVDDLFAVQASILPQLLPLPLVPLPHTILPDYLVSAPTGSGKTLAYAIPIIEILSKRVVTRLRALIVLPTRDLVVQVRETLEALAKGTGLTIGTASGQHSFSHEQNQLVADRETPLLGGSSKLDILIATPGRLIDHLTSTPNFTLQHLRFLVIDEADRLLTQSFQNWLSQVLSHVRPPPNPSLKNGVDGFKRRKYDAVAPSWMEALGVSDRSWEGSEDIPSSCQKLLFSATLTRDPSKVASLSLSSPRYYIVQNNTSTTESTSTIAPRHDMTNITSIGTEFALPSTLTEKMLILPPALKPLNLIHLIHSPSFNVRKGVLVFTKSVESSGRLLRLLEFFEDAFLVGGGGVGGRVVVRGYNSEMKAQARQSLLADFADGKVHILVCSDLIARGMDLPSVHHVVSYDIPLDMRKYVHRVGRTARAGREGTAWSLVEKQEALHFKGMMKAANHLKSIKKIKVNESDLTSYRESYDIAIRRLKEHFGRDVVAMA